MAFDHINIHRSNIKYELSSLYSVLHKHKQERIFKNEEFMLTYHPIKGMLLEGKNPTIHITDTGVHLPEQYTSVFQVPYNWIRKLKEDLT